MPSPQRRVNIELLLGISATFLSLAALVVSIFQTRIAREQQQASVWPYLKVDYSQVDDTFTLYVVNNGVGPALINEVAVEYAGKVYKSHIEPLQSVVDRTRGTNPVSGFYRTMEMGDVLKAGERLDLIQISQHLPTASKLREIVTTTSLFNFRVTYRDVYGNCWRLDRRKVTPSANCPE